ncbi:D-2-hydroxyacid dehydrogenase family protein [Serratia plymuthica]|uniref:D-2-hydroxyacid dehydrogenase family protein n=1 Tax=Serratia plymuthica TaxID=82996 RepID=A0A2X4U528_SERPL|nr:D-2-hydroxyacid dehydrogenase family protein [Serratia plymuthica]QPS21903.1 D-2-hydroxyacid dehydrogenase family protein [Serratia plymuthica]QPS54778.1 D-2-hydroxyacid dehydrogenase family protein [Serratia plymuthica]QPS63515.1 D-2-hydroxyacid dehydrogenase family protein [Serratia plymuthica]RKS64119.1 phosphoglycerate dehydrogenase-like enzyme [Serratia plymuthica]CAI1620050.1 Glyoxylate/hydroxypyruvate reductase B [Serratia plymuthica]
MKLKCAILDDYQQVALAMADWSAIAERVEVFAMSQHFTDEAELAVHLQDCDMLVIMRERTPITATLLARLPKLKLLITSGMRNASIDLAAAEQRGIVVCGTASGSAAPMELTWALLLGLAKHTVAENAGLRNNGPWQQALGVTLQGKTLGLLGLGKIGSQMARVAQAFGMRVLAWSQNLTAERAGQQGVALAESKRALFEQSDFVSVHLVLSERSRGLVGRDELAAMKPSAYLINTSRAAIVDQAALIEALQQQRIAGAGLDVFEVEPLPMDDIFRRLPNVLATPHLGYVADDNYRIYFREAIEDIEAFLAGQPLRRLG